ncbi:MAG TPA: phenylalanine--tRNA ligase subunit alpha [Acidimicrobiia bacterium]|nr:phenylalanine--tRNA ligase subunit alpha [Acidimicrobiia bacterium]
MRYNLPPDMDPIATLEAAMADAPAMIADAATLEALEASEASLLGKDSPLGQVRRSMGSIENELKPAVGAKLNEASSLIQDLLEARRAELEAAEEERRLREETIDVTVPTVTMPKGSLHLVQQTIDEVVDIFVGLGYSVASGPEAELAYYNFDALNTPPDAPFRWETDTMYLDWGKPEDEVLLRTQTSPVQARWMESHDPPVYIVVPGRTYRTDPIDATHLPVFHQIEGLAVDENLQFSDLKGTLLHFAKEFFGPETDVRLRPHYFPFTEPSAELDVSCFACDGGEAGCRVCGGAGWLELLGCGMVDPYVLEAAGYDSTKLSGFAYGMGPERLAMVRHGIDSLRHFIENDIRFLEQF